MRKSLWRKALGMALFAVLLNALAPSISMARAALAESPLDSLVVCSVQTDGHNTSPTTTPSTLDLATASFCQYCVTHAGSFGLAATEHSAPTAVVNASPTLRLVASLPSRLDPARLPPPRGPPVLSV
ncbi:DUF2946 family protein [Chitiniphilus eburneus]|uniref:DUF2946 domain-containing protein n=1 Tax=Chitiniphilus eburneus TaxID=2571148 RepID=A0A4U0Q508_9NEIS|nr:DUF2946 family protein [Chitiniphilus eburneus]TJZ76243.1 DUF2946 domain-containing protein [Chitiniphilus eburneus]